MKSETITADTIRAMQKERGSICVSIIVPTHRLSPERRMDNPMLQEAITTAMQMLETKYTVSDIKQVQDGIFDLYNSIDFDHNAEGIGLYISPGMRLLARFPFPVDEKIIVGDNFEIRDLLYKINYSVPYFVLQVAESELRLFEGSFNELNAINDTNFPHRYKDEYLYSKPARGTASPGYAIVRNFEKEKTVLEEIRTKDFFRQVDGLLTEYLLKETPLILLGAKKELKGFSKITDHGQNIVQQIMGNYMHYNEKRLADMVWPAMLAYFKRQTEKVLDEFKEKVGCQLAVSGLQDVWSAAREGKGYKLLVEKDYRIPGFVSKEAHHLFLQPPSFAHRLVADPVDDIIEMVISKGGQVYFADNGFLKDYQHIILVNRY